MNKKVLLVVIPLLVVIVAAIGVLTFILFSSPSTNDLYLEKVEAAQRYLDSGDIEQAILYYQSAIEANDMEEEPYLKLASIYYERQGNLGSALGILYQGRLKLNSLKIQEAIAYYESLLPPDASDGKPADAGAAGVKEFISETYSDMFASYTYETYSRNYTFKDETRQFSKYTIVYAQINGEFEYSDPDFKNGIVDPNSNSPYAAARPTLIRMNHLGDVISGAEYGVKYEQLISYGVQNLTLNRPDDSMTTNYLSFLYKNCTYKVECDANGVINNPDGVLCVIPPAVKVSNKATVSGSVLNATDNTFVSGATLNFREGINAKTGSTYMQVNVTDGRYSVEVDPGDYTVEVIADGYITEFYVFYAAAGVETLQSFVLSPKLGDNQMRFVVEWTETQYDLYIHIHGDSSNKNTVDYWEARYDSSGDVDSNLGGFEQGMRDGKRFTSATILDTAGKYEFHVHGGYDLYQPSDILSAGVTVKIYKDNNSDPIVVNVPSVFKTTGLYWVVCSVQNGEITYID